MGGSLWPCRARTQGSASIHWHGWQADTKGYSDNQGWHLLAQYGGSYALFGAPNWGPTVKCTRQGAGGHEGTRWGSSSRSHPIFLGGALQDPQDNMSMKGMVQQLTKGWTPSQGWESEGKWEWGEGGGATHLHACWLCLWGWAHLRV